jgi:hypothetical protein
MGDFCYNNYMNSFTKKEVNFLKSLNTPAKVQDFLNSLKFNFEQNGGKKIPTLKSPLFTLRTKTAHCMEGALLGAYILSMHGFKPLILHLKTLKGDYDHIITPFKIDGFWGALSKTNHCVLRYREPIYRNIRELCMSYFHEYFLDNGQKTLRYYSRPMNLNIFEKGWEVLEGDLWGIDEEIDKIKHFEILPKNYQRKSREKLRKADSIEIQAGKIEEYKK